MPRTTALQVSTDTPMKPWMKEMFPVALGKKEVAKFLKFSNKFYLN